MQGLVAPEPWPAKVAIFKRNSECVSPCGRRLSALHLALICFRCILAKKTLMQASVEISMYPLDREFGTPILQFIERLKRHPALEVHTNPMSTQVFGPYDELMQALNREMKESFQQGLPTVFVLKVFNGDLR